MNRTRIGLTRLVFKVIMNPSFWAVLSAMFNGAFVVGRDISIALSCNTCDNMDFV